MHLSYNDKSSFIVKSGNTAAHKKNQNLLCLHTSQKTLQTCMYARADLIFAHIRIPISRIKPLGIQIGLPIFAFAAKATACF